MVAGVGEDVEKLETTDIAGGNINWSYRFEKQSGVFSKG